MTDPRSATGRDSRAMADLPGSAVAGAFLIARHAGGQTAGTGVGLFALAAAHLAIFALLLGDDLLRRITG